MRIEELDGELGEVNRQMCELERELHYWLDLSPKVTASYNFNGGGCEPTDTPVQRALDQAEDRRQHLYERWLRLKERQSKLIEKIGELKVETARIDIARQRLNKIDFRIFDCRYFYEWSSYAIGRELNFDEKSIRKRIHKIVETMEEVGSQC
jgi:hypothetical protein